MLRHLIRKEILDHILSFRFLLLSSLGAVIIWASLYDGSDLASRGALVEGNKHIVNLIWL